MKFKNALVYDEQESFVHKDLFVKEKVFSNIQSNEQNTSAFDLRDHWIIPGLCDVHLHGAARGDFCDDNSEAISSVLRHEAFCGVTSVCAATMTLEKNALTKIMKTLGNYAPKDDEASLCGIYMEGPFIAQAKCGAQDPRYILRPNLSFLNTCNELAHNKIKFVTIAPELAGSIDFIKEVSKKIRVSLAHTNCTYEQASEAFRHGASQLTHAFNAMPQFTSRAPGPLAAASDYSANVELICDGVHLHEATVRTAFKLYGCEKILMISDSMRATGLADGDYSLGGQAVKVADHKATLHDGTIAGSICDLFSCLRTAVLKMRIPLADAIKATAINPRKALGIYPAQGIFSNGAEASFVICSKWLDINAVILRGKIIYGEDYLKTRNLADA